jgi:hypothetical protein
MTSGPLPAAGGVPGSEGNPVAQVFTPLRKVQNPIPKMAALFRKVRRSIVSILLFQGTVSKYEEAGFFKERRGGQVEKI